MLTLTKDYRLIGRDLNFVLENNQTIKEHFMTNPENVGASKWQVIAYFSTFSSVESYLREKTDIKEDELIDFYNLLENANKIIKSLENIETPNMPHMKVVVNKDWYFIGTNMFYRIIKRESIQSHRFTKEENIGKDKFINIGASPNVHIALKRILNEIILDFLSEKESKTIDDIKALLETFKRDIENLEFIEITPNNTEDTSYSEEEYDELTEDIESNIN